ncbi:MAG TPA: hypothetical protein VHB21_15355, partial [Minicystis sp.]|nr:hypothetical protein [Minicystis sp.]
MRKLLLAAVGVAGMAYAALTLPSCIDSLGFGGSGGADGGYDAGFDIVQGGESCTKPDPASIRAHFEPSVLYLTPCSTEPCPARTAKLVIEPDICDVAPVDAENPDAGFQIVANETVVTFTPADDTIVRAPMPTADESCSTDTTEFCVGYHRPAIPVRVEAGASAGSTTLAATFEFGGEKFASQLRVEVMPDATPKCSGTAKKSKLSAGETLAGKGGLLGASIAIPKGANRSEDGFVWSVKPFDATIGCAADIVPKGMFALGPAVTFGPEDTAWQREVPVTIPINPALLPEKARLRHVRVAYSGPAFKAPRSIPVADPRIVQVDGQWALSFQIPRLGTYQAVVPGDAGAHSFTRRLTHRAVIGISMGGGGTAMMGLRHHDKFDAIAPLGGPVDWTWELDYIEKNHLGGFRPIAPGTTLADLQATYGQDLSGTSCMHDADCQSDERCLGVSTTAPATAGRCVVVPPATEPYEHPQVFNAWWYEFPSSGNGGTFSRQDYIQIFRDLAIMFGNPNGENLAKGGENLPAGVRPDGKSVLGDHPNGECKINVDPVDCSSDPDPAACKKQNPQEKQQEIAQSCPIERCDHNVSLDHYYDDEYNPDGAFPVITVCDSSPQLPGATPWSNVWQPGFTSFPLEVGLAVDYNGNGVRDAMEPIIRAGHEKWYDDGVDHTPSSLEPGYEKGKNDDPNGDDYNAQYNPSGTEGDHRYEFGERFEDYGLDGV